MSNPFHLASITASILSASITLASFQQPKHNHATAHETGEHAAEMKVEVPTKGVTVLASTKGNDIHGVITLTQTEGGVEIKGKVTGLTPGEHGFHIHEFGDLTDPDGKSAGGHYNPMGVKHGGPHDSEHHKGDLGNIKADKSGTAEIDTMAEGVYLHLILGRSLVIHAGIDDLKSQPAGDSGPRVAVGVIGVAQK